MFNSPHSIRLYLGIAAMLLLSCYTIYHIYNGDKGLLSAQLLKEKISQKELNLAQLRLQKQNLERNIKLLQGPNPDNDYLDELARSYFMVGDDDDHLLVILDEPINNLAP